MENESIIFTKHDIDLFAAVSHDRNPLHCNYEYARKTPYGEPVVYGILGVLACLGKLYKLNRKINITKLEAVFTAPFFCDISYAISINRIDDFRVEIIIFDGERKLLVLKVKFFEEREMGVTPPRARYISDMIIEKQAIDLDNDAIKEGQIYRYEYYPKIDALDLLLEKFNLQACPLEYLVTILAWSSYSIGMVLPGRKALYSQIKLNIDKPLIYSASPIQCIVRVDKFNRKYNLLSMEFECFSVDGKKTSYGTFDAFIRQEINILAFDLSDVLSKNRSILAGKTALVTGASRGLGAVIAKLLTAMSCRVIVNFQYSLEDALLLQDEIIKNDGVIELWQGDISNLNWLSQKKEELLARDEFLDILICNACQPPQVLPLESYTVSRINAYISKNIELTSVPLSLFAPIINDRHGYGIIISSEYVNDPQKEFPHYVSVKAAIEGLVQSTAPKYHDAKWMIVRPPRMLTDMSNSPVDNRGLADPVLIAKSICERLIADNEINRSHLVEIFVPEA
ncbi:MAG: SDR family NAD(P)-dependent oxidoreductase [Prevotella sp.]|jgi:NAD(P)-dependent dehydrogenase (short-subunit alcohol dehydrogenase family)|nr:SDR family NAD(P)-dependent oxidoreductase [Prevotella sp.]